MFNDIQFSIEKRHKHRWFRTSGSDHKSDLNWFPSHFKLFLLHQIWVNIAKVPTLVLTHALKPTARRYSAGIAYNRDEQLKLWGPQQKKKNLNSDMYIRLDGNLRTVNSYSKVSISTWMKLNTLEDTVTQWKVFRMLCTDSISNPFRATRVLRFKSIDSLGTSTQYCNGISWICLNIFL